MDCYIWAITKDSGWNWIKTCLWDRNTKLPYGYNIRRFPKKSDALVFYGNKCFQGRITVADDGRQITPRDKKEYPYLKDWKNVMFLDGSTIRIFHNPVPAKDVADQIEKLRGKTGKSLVAACRYNPTISIDEYKEIVERGYETLFDEFFLLKKKA